MNTTQAINIQNAYIVARGQLDEAQRAHDAELVQSGLQARIDSASDQETLARLEAEYAPIGAKYQLCELSRACRLAEDALVEWSLDLSIRLRPRSAARVRALKDHCRGVSGLDPIKAEAIRLALSLPT